MVKREEIVPKRTVKTEIHANEIAASVVTC